MSKGSALGSRIRTRRRSSRQLSEPDGCRKGRGGRKGRHWLSKGSPSGRSETCPSRGTGNSLSPSLATLERLLAPEEDWRRVRFELHETELETQSVAVLGISERGQFLGKTVASPQQRAIADDLLYAPL